MSGPLSNLDPQEGQDVGPSVVSAVMKEFASLQSKLKVEDEDAGHYSPFAGLEKSTVLQEAAKAFNDHEVVKYHPKQCCLIITKLLFLLAQGENLSGIEATEVFFAVTKLFQSQDYNLRRMTYLFIKEVAESTDSQEIIIVTASLTKDMQKGPELYKANAIRVLCKIVDAVNLGQIERNIKEAVVDRNSLVACSALISGNQLVKEPQKKDVVKRWVTEVQEAVNSRADMVQYQALSLLYNLKSHDKLAISKLIAQLTKSTPRSPLARCLLVRYIAQMLRGDISASNAKQAFDFLDSCLRHKNDMVIYEAARAICQIPDVAPRDLQRAISVLQIFLSSPKPSLRFAAIRTLNQVAMIHPLLVTKCNEDMEALLSDSNRSIATMATSTLLQTGEESGVERLMKQIGTFMNEIADEFKIVVVKAIQSLCMKYPGKNRVLMNFLSNILREEGGFEFKKAIVETILFIMNSIPETKEAGLFHLCEFIEDCEFSHLSALILHVLGEMGPTTKNPAKYIRFIYNRIILENAFVRAAAASSLAKFAAKVESLRPSVTGLLKRCLKDDDDEVRDRATIALSLLSNGTPSANSLLTGSLPLPATRLLLSLEAFEVQQKHTAQPIPLSFETLPAVAEPVKVQPTGGISQSMGMSTPTSASPVEAAAPVENYAEKLYAIPQFANLGPLFKTTRPVDLTEAESEYLVRMVKHIFPNHVVLQFNLTNTLNDQLLRNVMVELDECEDGKWVVDSKIGVDDLPFDVQKSCYVCCAFQGDSQIERDSFFPGVLKFTPLEVDPISGEVDEDPNAFEEEYAIDDVELITADFIRKLTVTDFRSSWESIGKAGEVIVKFELPKFKSVEEAVMGVIDFLQMQPCEGTATIAHGATDHTILLAGVFVGEENVLVRTKLIMNEGGTVVLKIAVRSNNADLSETVTMCIAE